MSIKIIKNAMNEPIEVTCQECNSVISFTYDDIQRKPVYNLFGIETMVKRFVICPVCKTEIDYSPKAVLIGELGREMKRQKGGKE